MSIIALVLNLTLGGLLVAALGLGWRLERRLKSLRDSHHSFAQAVDDLDRAAARAEQGLADLRAATDEAAEALAGRIEKAKTLAARLDAAIDRAPAAPQPAAPRPQGLRPLRADLILEDARTGALPGEERVAARAGRGFAPAPPPATPTPPPLRPRGMVDPRSRARLDDDLFDEAPQPRVAIGGRR
jgi:ABC-type transporter Mla subunit MlaD